MGNEKKYRGESANKIGVSGKNGRGGKVGRGK